ncbi:MAG: CAP domain-containing protein [Bacteroidota bacterium]
MKMNPFFVLLIVAFSISCDSSTVEEEEATFQTEQTGKVENAFTLTMEEATLFDLFNAYRQSRAFAPLTFSEEAYSYAEAHNEYMISKGELSHEGFGERASRISRELQADLVAENVAKDYTSAEAALEGWLESADHRNTIEGDFTHSTLSITLDPEGNPYYTQIFFRK